MDEPRFTPVISGEVVPPQTFLHKVAPAPRDDAPDDPTDDAPTDVIPVSDVPADDIPADDDSHEDIAAEDDSAEGVPVDEEPVSEPGSGLEPDDEPEIAEREAPEPVPEEERPAPAAVATEPPRTTSQTWQSRPGDAPADDGHLLADGTGIREQWMRVQAGFVDDPSAAVSAAADVVSDIAARLESALRDRQQSMRERWDGNGRNDTEALRITMQQYRQLLERLTGL
jgi:hypothetical protein